MTGAIHYTKKEAEIIAIVELIGIDREFDVDKIANRYYRRGKRPKNWRVGITATIRTLCYKTLSDRRFTIERISDLGRGAVGTYKAKS